MKTFFDPLETSESQVRFWSAYVYSGNLKGNLASYQSKCMPLIKSNEVQAECYTFKHV